MDIAHMVSGRGAQCEIKAEQGTPNVRWGGDAAHIVEFENLTGGKKKCRTKDSKEASEDGTR